MSFGFVANLHQCENPAGIRVRWLSLARRLLRDRGDQYWMDFHDVKWSRMTGRKRDTHDQAVPLHFGTHRAKTLRQWQNPMRWSKFLGSHSAHLAIKLNYDCG
ncbi:hypothetical protein AVEN_84849-1 [Araneus ventricosus]|uniref:Uncharacterized protein n=1 Tax=Araneus ventricosus TaxID=182803 RepID=A0A4Y2N4W4_ARAVE|nr:hypothetical protein AVEN_84849-1 [Araneus ventricosus]